MLERRAGLSFSGQDVYVSVAGGIRVAEPAVDLPLALALASALSDVPVPSDLAAFGEVGLTGHVRPVAHAAARCREAVQLGFARIAARPGGRDDIARAFTRCRASLRRSTWSPRPAPASPAFDASQGVLLQVDHVIGAACRTPVSPVASRAHSLYANHPDGRLPTRVQRASCAEHAARWVSRMRRFILPKDSGRFAVAHHAWWICK